MWRLNRGMVGASLVTKLTLLEREKYLAPDQNQPCTPPPFFLVTTYPLICTVHSITQSWALIDETVPPLAPLAIMAFGGKDMNIRRGSRVGACLAILLPAEPLTETNPFQPKAR